MPTTPTIETTSKPMPKVAKDYLYAIGRRKTATARVRLYTNEKGDMTVNGMRVEEYFPGEANRTLYLEPLRTCNVINKYKISIKIEGSGKQGQLGALIHGLSRALCKLDDEKFRPILKKRGFLMRDPRMKERRMVGTGGKSRRMKQSPRR